MVVVWFKGSRGKGFVAGCALVSSKGLVDSSNAVEAFFRGRKRMGVLVRSAVFVRTVFRRKSHELKKKQDLWQGLKCK